MMKMQGHKMTLAKCQKELDLLDQHAKFGAGKKGHPFKVVGKHLKVAHYTRKYDSNEVGQILL
jgi:hypothetical protein